MRHATNWDRCWRLAPERWAGFDLTTRVRRRGLGDIFQYFKELPHRAVTRTGFRVKAECHRFAGVVAFPFQIEFLPGPVERQMSQHAYLKGTMFDAARIHELANHAHATISTEMVNGGAHHLGFGNGVSLGGCGGFASGRMHGRR